MLWPDHLGLARGKYLPARLAHKGTSHCVCVFALGYDRSMVPAPGAYLLDGLPDTQITFDTDDIRQGWDDDATGVVIGDLSMRGEPLPVSPREALRRAVADWEALGYTPRSESSSRPTCSAAVWTVPGPTTRPAPWSTGPAWRPTPPA